MTTRIVKMGNSLGIRIPKPVLTQLGLTGEVHLEVRDGQLVVRPVTETVRAGWDEQFQAMAARGDDALLDEETVSGSLWDGDEWQW